MQTLGFSTFAALAAALALVTTGCGQGDFNYGKIGHLVEGSPIHLDAEYVMLNQGQVDCGVQEDLWDQPPPLKGILGERSIAHLTDKGRNLKFSDDVTIGELRQPFAQVRGDFNLQAIDIQSDRDGPQPGHQTGGHPDRRQNRQHLFPQPGATDGRPQRKFHPGLCAGIMFRYGNGWEFEKFVH